ncbi:diacylglycerol/lipid kinase family protein [Streptosporangium lutulentum]
MRAMLLVNPKATTTNRRTRDVLIRALSATLNITVEETRYRGHAAQLSRKAHASGFDVVAVLGGDGTINETGTACSTRKTARAGTTEARWTGRRCW